MGNYIFIISCSVHVIADESLPKFKGRAVQMFKVLGKRFINYTSICSIMNPAIWRLTFVTYYVVYVNACVAWPV